MINPTTLGALAALAIAAAAQPAASREPAAGATVSARIALGALNLDSRADAKILLRRIRRAAESLCGPIADDLFDNRWQYSRCVIGATDRAVARLDNPTVTALNGGHRRPASVQLADARP
ncbi:MAG: UrcA family protein [Pseudomonadota bacterium]